MKSGYVCVVNSDRTMKRWNVRWSYDET